VYVDGTGYASVTPLPVRGVRGQARGDGGAGQASVAQALGLPCLLPYLRRLHYYPGSRARRPQAPASIPGETA